MNSADVVTARARAGVTGTTFCTALRYFLPVLEQMREDARGRWKFWVVWGIDALIAALRDYQRNVCPTMR